MTRQLTLILIFVETTLLNSKAIFFLFIHLFIIIIIFFCASGFREWSLKNMFNLDALLHWCAEKENNVL